MYGQVHISLEFPNHWLPLATCSPTSVVPSCPNPCPPLPVLPSTPCPSIHFVSPDERSAPRYCPATLVCLLRIISLCSAVTISRVGLVYSRTASPNQYPITFTVYSSPLGQLSAAVAPPMRTLCPL